MSKNSSLNSQSPSKIALWVGAWGVRDPGLIQPSLDLLIRALRMKTDPSPWANPPALWTNGAVTLAFKHIKDYYQDATQLFPIPPEKGMGEMDLNFSKKEFV